MLNLKRINEPARTLERMAVTWRQRGEDVALEIPSPSGVWLSLGDADQRWQGWLKLRDWLEYAAPELADLALSADLDKYVVQWLAAVEQPLVLPIPELAYHRLYLGTPVMGDALPQRPMLRVKGEHGPLWLERVPENDSDEIRMPAGLSWPVRFVIGDSQVSLALLGRIGQGDVLLISAPVSEVRCYTRMLATYQQSEEGITMEYQESQDEYEYDDVPTVHNMRQLPVQLEFVLHNQRLTLAELQAMYQGQLLRLPTDAEFHVEIRVNGASVGHGELVQLDGQLGVEVNKWFGESKDDE